MPRLGHPGRIQEAFQEEQTFKPRDEKDQLQRKSEVIRAEGIKSVEPRSWETLLPLGLRKEFSLVGKETKRWENGGRTRDPVTPRWGVWRLF